MKMLHIQLQPELIPELGLADARALLEEQANHPLVESCRVTVGHDVGAYLNLDYATNDLAGLWFAIRAKAYEDSPLAPMISRATIVACEGKRGWDDYRLLHHFDPAVPLDDASEP